MPQERQPLSAFSIDQLKQMMKYVEEPGFMDRLKASTGGSPAYQANIYRNLGYDAEPTSDGVAIRTPDGLRPVDKPGLELNDLADFGGDALMAVGGMVGAGLGAAGGPVGLAAGSAAGAATGEAARQFASQSLGSKEPLSAQRVATEGAIGGTLDPLLGTGGSKLLSKIAAPLKGKYKNRIVNEYVVNPLMELDATFGANVAGNLPLTSLSDSPTLGRVTQVAKQTRPDAYQENVERPFEREVNQLFSNIVEEGGIPQAAGRDQAGEMVGKAVTATDKARRGQINQAYDEFRKLVGPNQPAAASKALARTEELIARNRSEGREAAVEVLEDWADRISGLSTIDQLNGARKDLFAATKQEAFGQDSRGLDAELKSVLGAIKDDIDDWFLAGGRPDDAALAAATAAGRAAEGAGNLQSINLGRAIDDLGGMDISGLTAGELPGKVRGRLRRIQNKGGANLSPDIVAQRLAEEYPELGVTNLRTLKERLSKDASFFEEVPLVNERNVDDMFAQRAGQVAVDADALERQIARSEDLNELLRLAGESEQAVEQGLMSRFEADRLGTQARQRMLDLSGGAEEGEREALQAAINQMDERFGRLGQEMKEKGLRARTLAREEFDLDEVSAAKIIGDEEKLENVTRWISSSGTTLSQINNLKKRIGVDATAAGLQATKEGAAAWRALQAEVINSLESGARVKRGAGLTGEHLSGPMLLRKMQQIDPDLNTSRSKLKAILGEDTADALYQLGKALEAAGAQESKFINPSGTAASGQMLDDASGLGEGLVAAATGQPGFLLRFLGGLGGRFGMASAVSKPASARGRRWLGEGLMQGEGQQQFLRNLGQFGGRIGSRNLPYMDQVRRD